MIRRFLAPLALCGFLATTASAYPLSKIKIMPLGDSITEFTKDVEHCPLGYRYELFKQLVDTGMNFDLVGSHSYHDEEGMTYPLYKGRTFPDHNNGWGGWTAHDLLTGVSNGRYGQGHGNLDSWLKDVTPDVVLLHIGTNDSWASRSVSEYKLDVSEILDKLVAANPRVVVYLAKIIPFGSKIESTAGLFAPGYRKAVEELAAEKHYPYARVVLVDQFSGYIADSDNACDGQWKVHPGVSGAQKMAAKWVAAIKATFEIEE